MKINKIANDRSVAVKVLIHLITNKVTATDVVNTILAAGGSAICGEDAFEAAEITSVADGLVLNIGTPKKDTLDAMLAAGIEANKNNIPVILDPVGIGVSKMRQGIVKTLVKEVKFSCIRGNYSEIAYLAGMLGLADKGKDAEIAAIDSNLKEISLKLVKDISKYTKAIVIASGEEDLVADNNHVIKCTGGSEYMRLMTGSGCILDGLIALSLAQNNLFNSKSTSFEIIKNTIESYNKCSEIAENNMNLTVDGPSRFKTLLIDAIFGVMNKSFNQLR